MEQISMGGSKINMFRNKVSKGRIHINKNDWTLEKPMCQRAV